MVVLNQRNYATAAWCETCGQMVQMLTPDQAAQLCQVSTRTIYRRIENGRLHFTETEKGFSLVCLQSLETNSNSNNGYPEEAITRQGFFRTRVKQMLKRR